MTREPIEVTRQDRIYCLKASSDYHSEVCEECKFYPNCDHMTQDDLTELTIKDLEALEQEPCDDAIGRSDMLDAIGHGTTYTSEELQKIIKALPPVTPQKTGHWILADVNPQEPCNDAISRQAVIDEMCKRYSVGDMITLGFIQKLPSVNPQTDVLDAIRAEVADAQLIGYATVNGKREIASKAVMEIIDKYRKVDKE